MISPFSVLCVVLGLATVGSARAQESAEQRAAAILKETGIKGGVVVHLSSGDGLLTAALRANDSFLVQGLDPDAADVAKAREFIRSKGSYGRVSVDRLSGTSLPYIDNFVNLVVAEDLLGVSKQEIERVLCPNGVGYIRQDGQWTKIVKPWPKEIDDWTHYFHDSTGNAVAHDSVVAPPERLQWVGSPRWSRHHDRMASMSALVSGNGRLAYIMDEGSRISIQLPSKWSLISRDAFNGTVLWQRPIEQWHNQMWPLKSGPTQLARRLVADRQHLYVTLGIKDAVSKLDAATGETVHLFESTKGAEEIVLSSGTMFCLVNTKASELDDFAPKLSVGDQKRVDGEYVWNESPREIQALDAATGNSLWKLAATVVPLTLSVDAQHVVFADGTQVVCLDRTNGKPVWKSEPTKRRKTLPFHFAPRLVLHKDVVLHAGGDGRMQSLSASTGKLLWESEHAPSGYQSPQDLIVTGGLVWVAPTTSGRDSGIFTGRDPLTGEVKSKFAPDIDTYWFHHRCYIAKATDRFLIPSRTGIEFVDFKAQHWDINHWVRGGCLYGVMPCNGLLYAPPHDCACYPEAKLYGLNALAPALTSAKLPKEISEVGRLEQGPAFEGLKETAAAANEWPTYRHDNARSGHSDQSLAANMSLAWDTKLTGRLSSLVIADKKVFVAQIDAHTVHALDSTTGKSVWTFTAGARVDSPPTFWKGRVFFGSTDGWVYCLRAADGELAWRYRAAPVDRRLGSFEQIESVWPVHGSILVEDDVATFVVGRSSFLDDGMRYVRLNARTGEKLSETLMNDRDPATGEDLQKLVKTLQMPVALNDLLSSNDEHVFLRSQKFDKQGKRLEIAPVSGNSGVQGGTQKGPDRHLFAPMGFLDESWFHRSYWVYGKSFAGGHDGYYQAGKYTPSGRILVFNDKEVFGYARQPQYYRWTTPLEHQLFSASREAAGDAPVAPAAAAGGRKKVKGADDGATVSFEKTDSLDPSKKPLTLEAWVKADAPAGVIVAHGGPTNGYALTIAGRKPSFHVRSNNDLASATADVRLPDGWSHLAGVLSADKSLKLYVNGRLAGKGAAKNLIATNPAQPLEIGADNGGAVGDYQSPNSLVGAVDEVRIVHRELTAAEIAESHADPEKSRRLNKDAVVALSFDAGNAKDESGHKNDGDLNGQPTGLGKVGTAVLFPKVPGAKKAGAAGAAVAAGGKAGGMHFEHQWTQLSPIFARSMVLAKDALLVAGPPDTIYEELAFERLAAKDPKIAAELKLQDEMLDGKHGFHMRAVSLKDGSHLSELKLDSTPVWDGMSVAYGRVFIATIDGRVVCLGRE